MGYSTTRVWNYRIKEWGVVIYKSKTRTFELKPYIIPNLSVRGYSILSLIVWIQFLIILSQELERLLFRSTWVLSMGWGCSWYHSKRPSCAFWVIHRKRGQFLRREVLYFAAVLEREPMKWWGVGSMNRRQWTWLIFIAHNDPCTQKRHVAVHWQNPDSWSKWYTLLAGDSSTQPQYTQKRTEKHILIRYGSHGYSTKF